MLVRRMKDQTCMKIGDDVVIKIIKTGGGFRVAVQAPQSKKIEVLDEVAGACEISKLKGIENAK